MQAPNNKRREEVATVIKSCLISRQGDVTIRMLEKDYEEYEGVPIPFREFNCPSLLVFLNQLHNTLKVEKRDGQIIVHPLDSEKSRHISSLVEKQRSNRPAVRRMNRRPYLGYSGGGTHASINSFLMMELIRYIKQFQKGLSIHWAIQFVNQFCYPVVITRSELERQLREITHEVVIYGDALYPAYQVPVPSLFSFNYNYPLVNQLNQLSMKGDSPLSNNQPKVMPERRFFIEPMQKSNDKTNMFEKIKEDTKTCQKTEEIKFIPAGFASPTQVVTAEQIKIPSPTSQYKEKNFNKVELNITGNQYEACSLYQDKPNYLQDKDSSSKKDQNFSRDKILSVQNDEDHKYENLLDKEFEGDLSRLIEISTKVRLARLIHKYPNGIWCTDLPEIYLEEYKTSLIYSELGFHNIVDFCSHLPRIFHCVKPTNAEDYKLYNAAKPPPDLRNEKRPGAFPDKLDSNTSRMLLPEKVMGLGESVKPISVIDLGKKEGYEEVEISNIISPSFFWIQLRKNLTNFKKCMNELNTFYEEKKSKYKIPLIMLDTGMNVVCFSDEKWQRGIIKEVFSDGRATILFYDYGKEKVFPSDEIYFLYRSFSYLAAQAIPCGLFNVKPYQSSKWSKKIIWEFISKTSVPLIASIGTIDVQENSMLVILTDTRGEVDFHINDWMYEEKFAEQGQIFFKNQNFPFLYYKECLEQKGYDPSFIHNIRSECLKEDEEKEFLETKLAESQSQDTKSSPLKLMKKQTLLADYQNNQETEINGSFLKKNQKFSRYQGTLSPQDSVDSKLTSFGSETKAEMLQKFLIKHNLKADTSNDNSIQKCSSLLLKVYTEEKKKEENSLPKLSTLKPIKKIEEKIQKPKDKVNEQKQQETDQLKQKEIPPQIRRLLELQNRIKAD